MRMKQKAAASWQPHILTMKIRSGSNSRRGMGVMIIVWDRGERRRRKRRSGDGSQKKKRERRGVERRRSDMKRRI